MMQQGTVPPPHMVAPQHMGPPPLAMDHQQQPQQYPQPWMMMVPQPQPQPQPQQQPQVHPLPQPQPPPSQQQPPQMWNHQQQLPSQIPQPQLAPHFQPAIPQHQLQSQYQQPQQYFAGPPPPSTPDEVRTLWIGDLHYWMDENYILSCFSHTGEVISVKLIRNKQTNQLEGYGFIEFINRSAADRVLQTYNGTLMPNVEQNFRLNWASFGMGQKDTPDYTIFVGDLDSDVTDYLLQETFRVHYSSVKGAKIVTDRLTGRTKGYGFVKFGDETEQLRAMTEMNGVICSSRPMRIGPATSKRTVLSQTYPRDSSTQDDTQGGGGQGENDPNNTTIFVGGLDHSVTEENLRQVFSKYGELIHVKIPMGKRCGFVQYIERKCAEEALRTLNGVPLGGQSVRLSWGRSPASKHLSSYQADPSAWNGSGSGGSGYYGYSSTGYDRYGYNANGGAVAAAAPIQDANMYYGGAAYPAYTYPQQQQAQQQQ